MTFRPWLLGIQRDEVDAEGARRGDPEGVDHANRQRAEGLRLRAEQREAAAPEPPVDIPHTIEEHAAGREAIQATRKLHVAHANAELAEWSGLRTFVHVTEEAGLLLPMDCPCCGKVSCVRWEK